MIPYVFRVDTRGSGVETEALDAIWENMDDFRAKAADLEAAAGELEAAVSEGRAAAIAAFRATGGKCKACHDEYREEH
jgi:cytochrome c556